MLLCFVCLISCFSSCGEDKADENVKVSEKTSVVMFSQTITAKGSDYYSLKVGDGKKEAKAAGGGFTVASYAGEELTITVNMHNFGTAYAEHFDNDTSFDIKTGCEAYGADTQICVFPELSFMGEECYMSVVVRCIVTDEGGNITLYQRAGSYNLDKQEQPSLYLIAADKL